MLRACELFRNMVYAPLVPGDREGRPYISWRTIGLGNVGATLAVARLMDNSLRKTCKHTKASTDLSCAAKQRI